jgi:Ca2+-binding RTX toxin-like protein
MKKRKLHLTQAIQEEFMSTNFIATSAIETFTNPFTVDQELDDQFNPFDITTFADNSVDYGFSNAAVSVDLAANFPGQVLGVIEATPSGGFADFDQLVDVYEVSGSGFDDILRGSNASTYLNSSKVFPDSNTSNELINNPGDNVLNGGAGNDILEGRGGADTLNGGSGFDFASYESSPGAVTVRLPGVGSDTQTAIATGADATGDTLSSIEGLVGSRFDDHLTGNSLNNILVGGLGNDTLDGKGGIDTVDYSTDHILDFGFLGDNIDSADLVQVHLGLNGAQGTGAEFKVVPGTGGQVFTEVSVDTLISIENVTGTAGSDSIVGNEQDNVLDGRGGNDLIDGGFGNDVLIGGGGSNTVSLVSHDVGPSSLIETNTISLGQNGADGSYTRSHFVFTSPVQVVIDETDVLRQFQNVQGSNRPEAINGNEQNNVLDGRGGNDTLDGGLGNDTLIGGDGIDTVSYASHDNVLLATPGVVISLGLGSADGSATDSIVRLGPAIVETDVLRSIENVSGSSHSDTITGNEQDNVLDGRGGNDALDGGLGNDTLIGGGGNDTAVYTSHDNTPLLPGEQDVISLGLNGADGSFARSQLVSLNPVQFQVVEHDVLEGIENIIGSNHSETINGNEQANILIGRGGNDNLNGGDGGDVYNYLGSFGQNFGNDKIFDSSGNDTIAVTNFSDVVGSQRDGNDLILTLVVDGTTTVAGTIRIVDHFGSHQVESIVDSHGNSMVLATGLTGGNAPGIITAGNGGETLDGKGGDDFLFGGNGNDRLIGGDGNDRLTGGNGQDTFVFAAGFGHDTITDFTPADRIEFDGHIFRNFQAIEAASQQVGNDTVITLDDQNSITLQNVALSSLHAHDFIIT